MTDNKQELRDIEKEATVHIDNVEPNRDAAEDGSDALQPEFDPNTTKRILRKQDWRLIPMAAIIYLIAHLDRNARIMNSEQGDSLTQHLHLSPGRFKLALLTFFIAYVVFEPGMVYLIKRLRPNIMIGILVIGWGSITMLTAVVKDFGGLAAARFFVGMFEAGLYPGLVFLLTFWYRPEERSIRTAIILASSTLAGAFGGALAYGISHINGRAGIQGYRWLFLIEGAPSVAVGIATVFLYPSFPERSSFLSASEKSIVAQRMKDVGSSGRDRIVAREYFAVLANWRIYAHSLIVVGNSCVFNSISLFAPTIIKGLGYTSLRAQLLSVPPYAVAYGVTLLVAWSGDRTNSRGIHCAVCMVLCSVCFWVMGAIEPTAYAARYALLIIATATGFPAVPVLSTFLSANLHTTTEAAVGLPVSFGIGYSGMIIGLFIYNDSEAPGYKSGHFINAGMSILSASAALGLVAFYSIQNRRIKRSRTDERLWAL